MEKIQPVENPETGARVYPWMDAEGYPILTCGHREYREGRCGEMACQNYINKI